MNRPIEIIAHRGANREASENTLPAFQRALDVGVDGVELDVHLTRDGVPVVHHDPVLHDGRTIASLSLTDLRESSETPTLTDVLDLVASRSRVYVEIKAAAAVDAVVDVLRPFSGWCAVHSFDHRTVLRARMLGPTIDTGILIVSYLVDTVSAMRAANARDVWQHRDFIDRALVDSVHGAGGRVIAWTENDVGRARALGDLGVDGICTDTPRELREGLAEAD